MPGPMSCVGARKVLLRGWLGSGKVGEESFTARRGAGVVVGERRCSGCPALACRALGVEGAASGGRGKRMWEWKCTGGRAVVKGRAERRWARAGIATDTRVARPLWVRGMLGTRPR